MALTHQELANRCRKALATYSDEDIYTNLVDFLADAMHWCEINGHNFHDALRIGSRHFDAETTGDEFTDDLTNPVTKERT
jgi:hypothetical protein